MTRSLASSAIAVLLFGLTAAASPMISVDMETYEFGTIVEGYAIEHTFVLTNVGDETLVINQVRATCGCTTTALATNELEPGESVGLTMVVSTAGNGGNTNFSKYLYVYTNDPRYAADSSSGGQKLTLFVRGSVIDAQPYHISTDDLHYYYVPLVDSRSYAEYAAGHLVGAVNVPAEILLAQADALPRDNLLVIYDANGSTSAGLIESLINAGFPMARYLDGGIAEWSSQYGSQYMVPVPEADGFGDPAEGSPVAGLTVAASDIQRGYTVLLDVRTPDVFGVSHLFGAINMPAASFSVPAFQAATGTLPTGTEIIVYDASGSESDAVAQALIAAGYVNARSLLGGLTEWERAYGDDLAWSGIE